MNSHLHQNKYYPAIDGLRAVAVLGVILFHFNSSWLAGGFSGVDVFFVISGYVVTGSLYRDLQLPLLKFITNFYSRRIVRILPALLVCIVVTGIVQTLIVPPSWLSTATNKTALFAFFGFSNVALVLFSDGYFSPRVEFNAFTHTWSLGVEEQFYLLFPLVFFLWSRSSAKTNGIGTFAKLLLPILVLGSLIYCAYVTTASPQHAYYLLPSRFWELGCGAGLFMLHKKQLLLPRTRAVSSVVLGSGLTLIGLGLCFSVSSQFPFPWALLPVVGCMLALAGLVGDQGHVGRLSVVLDNRLMVAIGRLSYSLYLWHWPVLVMFRWTVGIDTPLEIAAAFVLIAALSILSLNFVEKPVRQGQFFKSKPGGYIVSRGLALAALCSVATFSVFKLQPHLSLSTTRDYAAWYPQEWSSEANNLANKKGQFAGRRLFVMGDSHAGSYGTLLRKLVETDGAEVQLYSMAGCSVANLLSVAKPDCASFIQRSVAEIGKQARPGDIVFLASLRMRRLSDQWTSYDVKEVTAKQLTPMAAASRAAALQEASSLISELEKHALVVILDAPKPVFKSPPFRCSDSFNQANPVCRGGLTIERSFLQQHRQAVMDSLAVLQHDHRNLIVWDTFPILCPSQTCSAYDGKQPLFFDGDHMSGHADMVLYPAFVSLLSPRWNEHN